MSNKSIISYAVLCGLVLMAGCKKFVESGNVNINPNKSPSITLATALPAVQYTTANNHALLGYITTMFSQQMAAYSSGPLNEDRFRDVRISSAFEGMWTALANAKLMVDAAKQQGAPHYTAIARILFVTNLTLATDTYGDLPLTEAFKAPQILQPKYDKQEDIYTFMHKYLDSAIDESKLPNPSTLKPGVDDLIYGGDTLAWRRTAYFLKARLYMHTTKKGAAAAAQSALDAMQHAFTSTSKDYQMIFSERNPNPWFVNVSGRISGSATFTIAPSRRFCNAINGTYFPGLVDPRAIKIIYKRPSAGSYTGITNGAANTGNTADLTDTTFYGMRGSPLVMATYSEQKLMEAEALFLKNGGDTTTTGSTADAYAAYLEGIRANMDKLTVPIVQRDAYIANALVSVGADKLKIAHIMREKMVTQFLNPDMWVDVRRYDYNPNLFTGMELPVNINPDMGGKFIRRSLLPLVEVNRNPNAKAALKPMTEKMWWDQ